METNFNFSIIGEINNQLDKNATALNVWGNYEASKYDEITCANDTLGLMGGAFAGRIDQNKSYAYQFSAGVCKSLAKSVSAMSNTIYDHRNQQAVNQKIENIYNDIDFSLNNINNKVIQPMVSQFTFNPDAKLVINNLNNLIEMSAKFIGGLKEIEIGTRIKSKNDQYTNPIISKLETTHQFAVTILSRLNTIEQEIAEIEKRNHQNDDSSDSDYDTDSEDNELDSIVHYLDVFKPHFDAERAAKAAQLNNSNK